MKTYFELFISFFKIGLLTFGGGYSMMPMFLRELCENRKWVDEDEVLNCYALAQCTPGVIAVNMATYVGYKKKGVAGGIFATLGVVFPSLVIITVIAAFLRGFAENEYVRHAFAGITVAVLALVVSTLIKFIKKSVVDIFTAVLCVASFVAAAFFGVSPIIVTLAAAILGAVYKTLCEKRRNGK